MITGYATSTRPQPRISPSQPVQNPPGLQTRRVTVPHFGSVGGQQSSSWPARHLLGAHWPPPAAPVIEPKQLCPVAQFPQEPAQPSQPQLPVQLPVHELPPALLPQASSPLRPGQVPSASMGAQHAGGGVHALLGRQRPQGGSVRVSQSPGRAQPQMAPGAHHPAELASEHRSPSGYSLVMALLQPQPPQLPPQVRQICASQMGMPLVHRVMPVGVKPVWQPLVASAGGVQGVPSRQAAPELEPELEPELVSMRMLPTQATLDDPGRMGVRMGQLSGGNGTPLGRGTSV